MITQIVYFEVFIKPKWDLEPVQIANDQSIEDAVRIATWYANLKRPGPYEIIIRQHIKEE